MFSEDARQELPHLNVACEGRAEIVKMIEQIGAFDLTMHAVHNQLVELHDATSASAETYCVALHFWTDKSAKRRRYEMLIRYQDELVVEGDRWRIKRRTLLLDEEWIDAVAPMPEGGPLSLI